MHRARIIIVMSRLRDSVFCGTPLASASLHEQPNAYEQSIRIYACSLVRSEEKGRGVLEGVLYVAFFLSALLVIWEFAQGPVRIQAVGLEQGAVSQATRTQVISHS
jgi:hypothetical protein